MFGVGSTSASSVVASTMAVLLVDVELRCRGSHRGKVCGMLQMEQAGRPWVWTCPRCGFRNASADRE